MNYVPPFTGRVTDAGGGMVDILVDRDTGYYPAVGETVLVSPDEPGVARIAAERHRQITVEGWDPSHDDQHADGELLDAARCYTLAASWAKGAVPGSEPLPASLRDSAAVWPWDEEWWKPSTDPIRNLEKAGALIAAEISRLTRAQGAPHA